MIIRKETTADYEGITAVTIAAFKTLEISNNTEQYIITALRAADALAVSLVAEQDGTIVGHIAFSPVTISDGSSDWYGLGPLAVQPALHGQGIGTALVHKGLDVLRQLHAQGCVVVGHPGYYPRFGFSSISELIFEGVPPEVFMGLPFGESIPRGIVAFHEAFNATG